MAEDTFKGSPWVARYLYGYAASLIRTCDHVREIVYKRCASFLLSLRVRLLSLCALELCQLLYDCSRHNSDVNEEEDFFPMPLCIPPVWELCTALP